MKSEQGLMAIGGYKPGYPRRPNAECPEWMLRALQIAMDFIVKNETRLLPGKHKGQFEGVTVTMIVPDMPLASFLVSAQEHDGKTWQLIRVRKPGR